MINFISMTVPQFVVMAFMLPSMVGAEIGYLVCSASKACIMTGLAPHVNGLHSNCNDYFKPAAELTISKRARQSYRYVQLSQTP